MKPIKENATLSDIQAYVANLEKDRGFMQQTVIDKCLLLGEEVGELFKAVRKKESLHTDIERDQGVVEEELADILIFLATIANRYNIDLETAFRDKENKNMDRTWAKE